MSSFLKILNSLLNSQLMHLVYSGLSSVEYWGVLGCKVNSSLSIASNILRSLLAPNIHIGFLSGTAPSVDPQKIPVMNRISYWQISPRHKYLGFSVWSFLLEVLFTNFLVLHS